MWPSAFTVAVYVQCTGSYLAVHYRFAFNIKECAGRACLRLVVLFSYKKKFVAGLQQQ